jgi:hypothetical protein
MEKIENLNMAEKFTAYEGKKLGDKVLNLFRLKQ